VSWTGAGRELCPIHRGFIAMSGRELRELDVSWT